MTLICIAFKYLRAAAPHLQRERERERERERGGRKEHRTPEGERERAREAEGDDARCGHCDWVRLAA